MKTAFVLFNQMTSLDLIGVYDPLTRLRSMGIMPDFEWDLCALTPAVRDDRGLAMLPSVVGGALAGYDMLVVPGGFGTRTLMRDHEFMAWFGGAAPVPRKVSVCTGALLLGSAGFLRGMRATTHPNAFHELAPFCDAVLDQRIVDEGAAITARGVTAAIDLGLYLVRKLAGGDAYERIRRQMDYPYAAEVEGYIG